ncbi:methyltransferase domain-containing protein [candidate division GN15 bacterium]|nr:methyltransferase domain-containing protein [candidate division GN15 bacterium]
MKTDSATIQPVSGRVRTGRWASLTNLFRTGLLGKLDLLQHGRLTIVEGESRRTFGPGNSALTATITVTDPGFYARVATRGSIGAAEAFMLGWWECDRLVDLMRIMVRNRPVLESMEGGTALLTRPLARLYHWLRRNTIRGSRKNIVAHYDLGNDFYRLFLDDTMTYSCGVFPTDDASLEEASIEKLDRICRKLRLQPDDEVLEIGGGWGSFAIHAARTYGARVTTTTISDEQFTYMQEAVAREGVSDRVTVLRKDYRELTGQYDKIVSIEMIEAVGYDNVPGFFEVCGRLLKPDGMLALQAITMSDRYYSDYRRSVDFIQRYVFPGSCLVSQSHLLQSVAGVGLVPEHIEDFGLDYATTLRRWRERFLTRLEDVRELGFDERFIRLWEYYLAYCEGGFRERSIGVMQLIASAPAAAGSGPAISRAAAGVADA